MKFFAVKEFEVRNSNNEMNDQKNVCGTGVWKQNFKSNLIYLTKRSIQLILESEGNHRAGKERVECLGDQAGSPAGVYFVALVV